MKFSIHPFWNLVAGDLGDRAFQDVFNQCLVFIGVNTVIHSPLERQQIFTDPKFFKVETFYRWKTGASIRQACQACQACHAYAKRFSDYRTMGASHYLQLLLNYFATRVDGWKFSQLRYSKERLEPVYRRK